MEVHLNTNHYATQFFSGHGNVSARLHQFKLVEDPWCVICGVGVEETAWHVFAECPGYQEKRREIEEKWDELAGEDCRQVCGCNAVNFQILARATRKVGRTKEGRGIGNLQE